MSDPSSTSLGSERTEIDHVVADASHFEAIVATVPDAIIVADVERRIQFVNEGFVGLFGYEPGAVVRKSARFIYADGADFEATGKTRFFRDAGVHADAYVMTYRRADGSTFLGETRSRSLFNGDGDHIGYVGIVRDITRYVAHGEERERQRVESEARAQRLHALHEVSSFQAACLDELFQHILVTALDVLGLDIGVFAEIEGPVFTAKAIWPPDYGIEPGDVFDLQETYCSLVYPHDLPLAISHMSESQHRDHCCYAKFGLESYVGVVVRVGGERFGTLNFSARAPRQEEFSVHDIEFVQLLADWMGARLEQEKVNDQLRYERETFEAVARLQERLSGAGLEPEASWRAFSEASLAYTSADGVALALLEEGELRVERASGVYRELVGRALHDTAVAEALRSSEPGRTLRSWNRSRRIKPGPGDDGPESMTSWIPLIHRRRTIGALFVSHPAGAGLPRRDRTLIEMTSRMLASQLFKGREFAETSARARTDSLTQLANRHGLFEVLNGICDPRAEGDDVVVAMIDLDHFKQINDEYGHDVGDEVLRQVARLLRQTLVDAAVIGRYGGEELVAAWEGVAPERVEAQLDEVRRRLGRVEFGGERRFRVGFSAGVARCAPSHQSVEEALGRADELLYEAKRAGRGRTCVDA